MSRTQLPRRVLTTRFTPSLAREMDQLGTSIRRLFDDPFAPVPDLFRELPQAIGWMPPVEIRENDGTLTITAELPGLKRDDVHVDVEGDMLTIHGEKREERTAVSAEEQYHLMERSYGAFHRAFTLPPNVDTGQVKAEFTKGVLTIELPKTQQARARGREIEIGGE